MFEQAFKNIDDVLWKEAGCTTELDYTEQTSWLLFLKYLDGLEQDRATDTDWTFYTATTQSRFVIDRFTSGQRVWMRCAAVGTRGTGPWSEPVSRLVL